MEVNYAGQLFGYTLSLDGLEVGALKNKVALIFQLKIYSLVEILVDAKLLRPKVFYLVLIPRRPNDCLPQFFIPSRHTFEYRHYFFTVTLKRLKISKIYQNAQKYS